MATITGTTAIDILDATSAVDTITGAGGADRITGTLASLNGDTITDFGADDLIVITDAPAVSGFVDFTGGSLIYGSTTIALPGLAAGVFAATPFITGGVGLAYYAPRSIATAGTATNNALTYGGISIDAPGIALTNTASGRILYRGVAMNQGGSTFINEVGGQVALVTGSSNFNPANGWTAQDRFARTLGDVNGDGFADIVGFGQTGTLVALGDGKGNFGTATLALANFGIAQGWTSDNTFHRELADVNGDGRDDVVGFGAHGTYVALGQANGTFATPILALENFGTGQGWSTQDAFPRDLGDVDGDGRDDIVGFGIAGTFVAYGKADGTFTTANFELANFGQNQGWTSDNLYHRELADLNGDGQADIVGFGANGVFVAQALDGVLI